MFAGCRCPRNANDTLKSKVVDGREVLACKRCGGVFVDAALGLRLLAVLDPQVPEHDEDASHPACPVCKTDMKRVRPAALAVEVDVCHKHGVWLDGSDLARVARTAAAALGKPVPAAVATLDAQAGRSTQPSGSPPSDWTSFSQSQRDAGKIAASQAPSRDPGVGERVLDAGLGVVSAGAGVVGLAVDVVSIPVELTLAVVGGIGDLFD